MYTYRGDSAIVQFAKFGLGLLTLTVLTDFISQKQSKPQLDKYIIYKYINRLLLGRLYLRGAGGNGNVVWGKQAWRWCMVMVMVMVHGDGSWFMVHALFRWRAMPSPTLCTHVIHTMMAIYVYNI